jgi:Uma2 family endonuclease
MSSPTPLPLLEIEYYEAAQEYLRSLPLEHFMEATPQATQREIVLESLALVKARRPEVHVFNELLVQYPLRGKRRPGQVVPDNMVVIHDTPLKVEGSYDVPLQPARPFWMLEYVSKSNRRKDYDDNRRKYEKELKVKYYLLFVPDQEEMVLFRHNGRRFVTQVPNEQGRVAIPELDLELGLLDGWVRFWFRGELLPLPGDLLQQMDQLRLRLRQAEQRTEQAEQRAVQAEQRMAQAEQRAAAAERTAEAERQSRLALQAELQRLRAQLPRSPES